MKKIIFASREDDPYTKDLIQVASLQNDVYLMDLVNYQFISYSKKTKIHLSKVNLFFKNYILIRIFFGILFAIYILLFKIEKDSILHILYLKIDYVLLTKIIKFKFKKIIISIYGDDFYSSKFTRKYGKKLLEYSNVITFNNIYRMKLFQRYYGEPIASRAILQYYLYSFVTLIDNITKTLTKNDIKDELKLPKDKTIIMLGTNGVIEQQHQRVIEIVSQYSKDQIYFIIPLTYGCNHDYKNEIELLCKEKLDNNWVILSDYLTSEDLAKYRVITDILIQFQVKDSLSGAMLQALYSNTFVILPNNLKYPDLEKLNIFIYRAKSIINILDGIEMYHTGTDHKLIEKNKKNLNTILNWNLLSNQWLNLYKQMES